MIYVVVVVVVVVRTASTAHKSLSAVRTIS
jgi:hypothetical protein